MDIIAIDPHDPGAEPTLRAMWDVAAAARADRPYALHAPWSTAYTTWTTPRGDQVDVLLAALESGTVVGMGQAALPLHDNQHLAGTEFLVHPDHRRRGIGTALLDAVLERSRAADRTVLASTAYSPLDSDGSGQLMLTARGFEVAITCTLKVCDLDDTSA